MNERPWMSTRWPIRCKFITCNAAPGGGLRAPKRPRRTSVNEMHHPFLVMPGADYESKVHSLSSVSNQASICSSRSIFSVLLLLSFHLLPHSSHLLLSFAFFSTSTPFYSFVFLLQGRAFSHTRQPPLFPSHPSISTFLNAIVFSFRRHTIVDCLAFDLFRTTFDLDVHFPLSVLFIA